MEDIRKWAEKLKSILDDQIEVFGYFSKYYSGYPPAVLLTLRVLHE